MCVSVTFYSTFVFIPPGFQFHQVIETLPSTTSSPVLIVAATNHDKHLRLDTTNIFWLINCHYPEHDRTTCVISYTHFFLYTLEPQSLSVVASVHCFSAEGLHFSALVFDSI